MLLIDDGWENNANLGARKGRPLHSPSSPTASTNPSLFGDYGPIAARQARSNLTIGTKPGGRSDKPVSECAIPNLDLDQGSAPRQVIESCHKWDCREYYLRNTKGKFNG